MVCYSNKITVILKLDKSHLRESKLESTGLSYRIFKLVSRISAMTVFSSDDSSVCKSRLIHERK